MEETHGQDKDDDDVPPSDAAFPQAFMPESVMQPACVVNGSSGESVLAPRAHLDGVAPSEEQGKDQDVPTSVAAHPLASGPQSTTQRGCDGSDASAEGAVPATADVDGDVSSDTSAKGPLVILVRHGETTGNASKRLQLPTEALSAKGVVQAKRLGMALHAMEGRGVCRIVSILVSDFTRTKQTLVGALEALGSDGRIIVDEALLQERNFGQLRGRHFDEVTAEHGNFFAENFAPPQGETWATFRLRVHRAWARVRDAAHQLPTALPNAGFAEPALLVVTHGLVLRVLSESVLGLPEDGFRNFGNTSVTTVRLDRRAGVTQAVVEKLNDVSHLPEGSIDDPGARL